MATTTVIAEPLESVFSLEAEIIFIPADEFDFNVAFDTIVPALNLNADELDGTISFDTITKRMYLTNTFPMINGLEINGTFSFINSFNHSVSGEISFINNVVLSVTGGLVCKNEILSYNPIGTRFTVRNYIEGVTSTSVGLYHYDPSHGI